MFTCDMSESQQKTVPLNGVEATIAEKLIDFAYTSGTRLALPTSFAAFCLMLIMLNSLRYHWDLMAPNNGYIYQETRT